MSVTKKIIGAGIILLSCLASSPARATNWVYIGNGKGFDYYVDIDREVIRGSFWIAPIRAVNSNSRTTNTTYLGKAAINCRNYTTKIKFGNNVNDWRKITPNSPMDFVGRKVCF